MEKDKLQEETVANEGHKPYNILNFQDFVLEEGKKGEKEGKKGEKETKKSKPKIKTREEYTDDGGDDFIDPNDNPERFIKLREQFIRENYK